MAVTQFGRVYQLASANDTLAGKWRINAIHIIAGATPTSTSVTAGGTSGIAIITITPAAQTTTAFTFSEPQEIDDLFFKTAGTNCVVVVFTC